MRKAILLATAMLVFAAGSQSEASTQGTCAREIALWGGPLNGGTLAEACPSRTRGFVTLLTGPRQNVEQVWWTVDAGHHWFRTERVAPYAFAGGGRVFWTRRSAIYRLTRWPSLARALRTCRNFSFRGACLRPSIVDAGIARTSVLHLDDAGFPHDAVAPLLDGFVAPVSNTRTGLPPRAVVVHGDRIHVVDLPDVGWYVCGAPTRANRALIAIEGCKDGGPGGQWVSPDGGSTWTTP